MYDMADGSQPETTMCERAAIMWRARGIKTNWAGLCADAPPQVDGSKTDLVAKLTAESERAERLAEMAGRIVRNCNGCDSNGIRLGGVTECPQETVVGVREWWEVAVRIRSRG